MRSSNRSVFRVSDRVKGALVGLTLVAASGLAPSAIAQTDEPDVEQQIRDFIFFVNINRDDAARVTAEQLLASGMSPQEILNVVESERLFGDLQEALGKAGRRAELEPVAGEIVILLRDARLQRARDPDEIDRNIEALTGPLRGKLYARDLLKAAGEYAMPQLLESLLQRRDPNLRTEVQRLMSEMGRSAVVPLSTALLDVDPASQELIASILGNLGYRTAGPFVTELASRTDNADVRSAAERAADELGIAGTPTADLYLSIGEAYYDQRDELTVFPGEDVQLLWDYDPAIGLLPTAIDTTVFHEAMAMRMAGRAMELGANQTQAYGLWVAANFSREIDEPLGYDNPAYPPSRREAMYYATFTGPTTGEDVLARALDDTDTPLARRAIDAIAQTAGPERLWSSQGRVSPLVTALGYPSRRVQYDAALALAASQPEESFAGSERVIPTLASALRFAGEKYAVVLAQSNERYTSLRATLEGRGYVVLPYGESVDDIRESLISVAGVDLVVMQPGANATTNTYAAIRQESRLSATPVLALAATPELPRLRRSFDRDVSIEVRPLGVSSDALNATIDTLIDRASGGEIGEQEAIDYAERAVAALRDLAVGRNRVLSVADATTGLVSAMNETTGDIRLRVAEVLAMIDRTDAQRTLAAAAFDAAGSERIALLDSLAVSARNHGQLMSDELLAQLVEIAETGADDEATSAAAVVGALGASREDVVRLILAGGR
ncbi:MAG: HEAT repeat domain-containing protein [Planctomycetota bacterium]